MLEIGAVLVRESRRFIVGMLASALAVSSVAAQDDIGAAKRQQLALPNAPIGPFVTITNGIALDGRLDVNSYRGGESVFVGIDPAGSPPFQNIMFELNHYVDVGADGGAIQLGQTTIVQEPTLTGANQVTSKGSFLGTNDGNLISWTAVATINPGSSSYVTTMTFSSSRAFGTVRMIQYADIDVQPFSSNNLVVLGTFNQPGFQLVTVQGAASGNIGLRQHQPQVANASCVGWAARPFPDLRAAITGAGAAYSPAGAVVGLNGTTDSRFPGSPAFGPADITAAIACDLNPNATTATIVFTIAAEDVTPPDTTILSAPNGTIPLNSATFTWIGSSPTTLSTNLTYAFRLAPIEPNFSAFGPATSKSYSTLPKGSYTFFVKARDPGNREDLSPAQASFTVDQNGSTITGTAGNVQVTFQGVSVPVGPGALVGQGVKLKTGADGQVQGRCDDGSNFSLALNGSLFLDDSLCRPAGSGVVDLTQGTFRLVGVGLAVSGVGTNAQNQLGGVRTPVSTTTIPGTNADFTTTYNEAGGRGTATTMVTGGTVAVTNSETGAVTMVSAGQQLAVNGPVPILVAAILPSSRSVQVGVPATVFATIINAGTTRAIACEPAPLTNVPVTFDFQPTNSNTNQPTGVRTTPISIAGRASQSFVLAFTPTAAIPPTELQLSFACGQTQAPITPGVNTLLLSAAPTPIPDIVALAATLGNDGIVNIPGLTGTGFFAVASVNVGAAATITATADMGNASLPVLISLCQTNAASVCLSPPGSSVTLPIAANATPTFAIFVTGTGAPVPFLPGQNRIFVRFKDADGNTRGSTSVAVRTQ